MAGILEFGACALSSKPAYSMLPGCSLTQAPLLLLCHACVTTFCQELAVSLSSLSYNYLGCNPLESNVQDLRIKTIPVGKKQCGKFMGVL